MPKVGFSCMKDALKQLGVQYKAFNVRINEPKKISKVVVVA
jgi:hypothetical protein